MPQGINRLNELAQAWVDAKDRLAALRQAYAEQADDIEDALLDIHKEAQHITTALLADRTTRSIKLPCGVKAAIRQIPDVVVPATGHVWSDVHDAASRKRKPEVLACFSERVQILPNKAMLRDLPDRDLDGLNLQRIPAHDEFKFHPSKPAE